MPHLDEGALWVRATTPYTISFDEASKLSPQIRNILLSFPQVTTVANELGRPDDGTDSTGFYNNEFYVGLRPYYDSAWNGEIHTKPRLIDAINQKLSAFPGIIFNYTQPAEDAVDEAETGLKSALAVKIFGADLNILEDKAKQVKDVISKVPGIGHIVLVRELGQPSLTIAPDRAKIARYGLNISDVNTLIETGLGGTAATQVIQGERQFDLVVRMQEPFRKNMDAIKNLLIATPDGQFLPLSQFADIKVENGASFIYRESNSRYIGIQFAVDGRDLASAVGEARQKVAQSVRLPIGYSFDWGGEYKDYLASLDQMKIILPLDRTADFADPVRAVRKSEISAYHSAQRAHHGTGGRLAGAAADWDQLQRVVDAGFRGADGGRGADQRHPLLVHQQVAAGGARYSGRNAGRLGAAPASDSDDRAGGLFRPAAGRHVDGNRERLAEAIRHCDRGWPVVAPAAVDLPGTGSLFAGGARRRRCAGLIMSPVLAYIGPGAGIAFAKSFLSLIVGFFLTVGIAWVEVDYPKTESWIFWFVAISTASALVFNRYA